VYTAARAASSLGRFQFVPPPTPPDLSGMSASVNGLRSPAADVGRTPGGGTWTRRFPYYLLRWQEDLMEARRRCRYRRAGRQSAPGAICWRSAWQPGQDGLPGAPITFKKPTLHSNFPPPDGQEPSLTFTLVFRARQTREHPTSARDFRDLHSMLTPYRSPGRKRRKVRRCQIQQRQPNAARQPQLECDP
jgi:hypothetical protein